MISNTLKWTHWINPRFSKCFSHHKKGQHLTVHKIKVKPIGSIRDPSSVFSHHNKGRYLIVHMSNFAMGTILGKGLPNFSHDKIVFSNNVCFIKFRSKLSSVLLLCLLRICLKQTLLFGTFKSFMAGLGQKSNTVDVTLPRLPIN